MPYIKRRPRRQATDRTKERQRYYQRADYRKAVDWYKRTHIWCQECLADGLYTPGVQLHHVLSPFDQNLEEGEKLRRLLDENNWLLLCDYHHRKHHHTTSPQEDEEYNNRKNKFNR